MLSPMVIVDNSRDIGFYRFSWCRIFERESSGNGHLAALENNIVMCKLSVARKNANPENIKIYFLLITQLPLQLKKGTTVSQ